MDPDQTAPLGAVWSGFILFASMKNFLSEMHLMYAVDVKSRRQLQDKNKLWDKGFSMNLAE